MSKISQRSTKRVVRAKRERQIITYSEHLHTANTLFQLGSENSKGSYHQFLASITFTAFALEAFLNHIGGIQLKSWSALEKISPKGKIEFLAEKLEVNVDFGKEPWQVVPEIFAVRNKIAHGKSELLEDERLFSIDSYDQRMRDMLQAQWQDFATRDNAERALTQVSNICKQLWAKAGLPENELFKTGSQFGTATLLLDEIN